MKEMTCAQMGGPETCDTVISGNTPEEMSNNGMVHINEEHPQMAEDIRSMPKEALDTWNAEFREKWDAAPEK